VYNWIVVEYRDDQGKTIYLTPDDDATLKDTTSISAYGQRDYLLNIETANGTIALDAGQAFLADRKDIKYRMSSPIAVVKSIRTKNGGTVPASQIRAGKRIRIENFLQDLSGTGLTFLISETDYDADGETCSVTAGDLVVY
jgi:hypothetical protein